MPTLTAEQVAGLAYNAGGDGKGFRGDALVKAVAIARAESGFVVENKGGPNDDGSFDYGLWQINGSAHPQYDVGRLMSDPAYNAAAAWAISSHGTYFHPWTVYWKNNPKTGKPYYLAYMPEAAAAAKTVDTGGGGGGGILPDIVGAVTNPAAAVAGVVSSAIGGVGNAASAGLDYLTGGTISAVKTTADAAMAFVRFLGIVANPELWRRIGLIALGVLVVGAGLVLINRDALGSAAGSVAKDAATAALAA